ncbi:putative B3 domain-containing protein Os03g0621600 [Lolium perenne]|uniref:putative B3 domain-containing protein Os03g0621600 n=1 Tax=Lolium perenne TaxID=4522 RepID=UPI0021F6252A|nr:putative B3 domain-containing protein Os03g0621600 [Lolium perenne]XP_051214417.1 putative B3 domain-containing protein Os03g0621600 [Lolium perenne]
MGKPCERSKKKGDYCHNHVEEQDNYFFKIMIGDFGERITIPDAFVKHFRGKSARTIKLESRNGCTFDAKITNNYDELVLQSGWGSFASAHDLKVGDLLLFKYNGISQLKVLIFDPSGCEKVQSHLVINNTGQELIDISSSFDDIPINSPQSERPNQGNDNVNISSSRSPPEASEDDLEAYSDSVPLYILPRGISLTDVQTKKLDKRVQAIQSKTPIYGCIMSKSSLYAEPSNLYLSRKYADTYLPFKNGTLILERHAKNWEVQCSITSVKRKRFTKGWKEFARDNS